MPKISACVISYNEEDKIEGCLKSLVGIADEIVVVDSQSTDRTLEIAGAIADRVITEPFRGYVGQKQFATDQAEHDWILSLDCDERISDELRAQILAVHDRLDEYDAYEMARRTFYVDDWVNYCWYPDTRVRLFDRRKARWGGIDPHDSVQTADGRVGSLKGDILHYSCDSVSAHLQTIDRFTEIGARELFDKGRRASPLTPLTRGTVMFLKTYLIKRGFLDGFSGLVVSVLSATATFTKWAKLRYLQRGAGSNSGS